jgi:hypothetical protein
MEFERTATAAVSFLLLATGFACCSACKPGVRQPTTGPIKGLSQTMTVRGEFKELPIYVWHVNDPDKAWLKDL